MGGTLSNIKDGAFEMPPYFSEEAKSLISSLLVWEKRDRMTIQQVREHVFFRGFMEDTLRTSQNKSVFTADSDCSFFEYRETFSSPKATAKQPPARASVPKLCLTHRDDPRVASTPRSRRDASATRARTSKSQHHDSSVTLETGKLVPLTTEHLATIHHKTKNGFVEITPAKWVVVEAGKRRIEISSDGLVVIYCGKKVPLSALSLSAVKLYEYAKDFIQAVESKTPKVHYQDEDGDYLLMWNNQPYQNFEAVFRTGERVMYQVGGEKMTIRMATGEEVTISPHQKPLHSHPIFDFAEKALNGLVACFRLEKEMDAKS